MSPKETLREEIKSLLKSVPREKFRSEGDDAAALLRFSPIWPRYKTVFLFLSMNSEIDTQGLLETSLKEGKKVFAPTIQVDSMSVNIPSIKKKSAGRLVFYPLLSPDGPWREGAWRKGALGIREPLLGEDETLQPAGPGDFPALIITPGIAFDREGNRLGRGGGFYDRFFAELDAARRQYTALGFCMDFQIAAHVPAGKTDKKVQGILTGKELYLAKR